MACRYMHWCPKGCGKKVFWTGERYDKVKKNFICSLCKTKFKRNDLD